MTNKTSEGLAGALRPHYMCVMKVGIRDPGSGYVFNVIVNVEPRPG